MSRAKPEKFEVCLEGLERIVHKLEEGEIPLDESLKAFEEGMRLAKSCEDRLNEAQKKIEILMKNKDGKKIPEDFDAD